MTPLKQLVQKITEEWFIVKQAAIDFVNLTFKAIEDMSAQSEKEEPGKEKEELCCLNDLYAGASARILPQENAGVQGTAFLSICCDPLSEMFKNLHTVQSARRFLWFKQFSTY